MFHADTKKLFEACQGASEQLRSLVGEVSPELEERLAEGDINFFPMIIQNWMIDHFMFVLPPDAAARLWHRVILDTSGTPGMPLKFALRLLLSKVTDLLSCQEEDINEVIAGIPTGIRSAEDVDALLDMDLTDLTAPPVKVIEWQLPTLKLKALNARLPKRWRPWKFMALAMVVPWLLMHATAVHQPARGTARPPAFRRPCFKGNGCSTFNVGFDDMTLPVVLAYQG